MRAHLRLELKSRAGETVAVREAYNSVLQSGADLLARLFSDQGTGITHMAVGTGDTPEGDAFNTKALEGSTEVTIPLEAFTIDAPDTVKRVVRVRVRATVPATDAIGRTIREAALLSRSGDQARLYNRVTFSPIEKTIDHELTLFWEVCFPYGDLQWLL